MKKTLRAAALILVLVMTASLFASCSGSKAKVKVIDIQLTDEDYAFGVDKNQPELLEKVNAFIKEIKENGKFDEICNHYFGDGTPKAVKSAELDTSKDQLVIATNAAFEPFEYKIGEDYFGVDMEIAGLLAEKLGMELVVANMEFASVCLSVSQGKADIAMSGLTVKEDRKEFVTFTDTYYVAAQKIIVKADDTTFDNCKTREDVEAILKGFDKSKTIGCQNGTTGQLYIEGDEDFGFEGLNVEEKAYSNCSLAVTDMLNGNIDLVIIDEAPAAAVVKAMNG